MSEDRLYRRHRNSVAPFAFDEDVAHVFDDMVSRSIPMYNETLRLTAEMIRWQASHGDTIVDVGASTGGLLEALQPLLAEKKVEVRAIDASESMIAATKQRVEQLGLQSVVSTECADIRQCQWYEEPIVVLNYVLQFIPSDDRLGLMTTIRQSVGEGGLVIVSEKVSSDDVQSQRMLDEFYYAFKRQSGYTEQEISQKRKALKGVLRPESEAWNRTLFKSAGFRRVQRMMSWMPFVTWALWP